jgi:DNA-directed RNA polymerase subunit K/omega
MKYKKLAIAIAERARVIQEGEEAGPIDPTEALRQAIEETFTEIEQAAIAREVTYLFGPEAEARAQY